MTVLILYSIYSYLWMAGFLNNKISNIEDTTDKILFVFMFLLAPIIMPILLGYKTGN